MTADQATFLVGQYAQLMRGEFAATCRVLAAVKDDTREFRPDPKSRSAWELATHLVVSDVWFLDSILTGAFVWDEATTKALESTFTSVDDVVAFYEKTFPEKLRAVQAMSTGDLSRSVDFFGMFQQPAVAFLGSANNHSIHHRGQLASYLRPMGSKVPAIYGGSADEPMPAS